MKKKLVSEETRIRISVVDLIKSDKPIRYLSELRLLISPDYYGKAIELIERYPNRLSKLLNSETKKSYKDLDYTNLVPLPFDNELTWAKSILSRNAEFINDFLILSKRYSSSIIQGNYDNSGVILNEIENKYGQSIWLIKNKIAFLQLTEGLESQKRYTQKIKDELRDRSLVKFVIHWISVRNEGKTTLNKFISQFEPIINRFDPIKLLGYKEYCKYHVLGIDTLNHDEFINVLRLEYSRSLIDYYEAFISILRVTVLNNEIKLKSKIKHLIATLPNKINDKRIEHIETILNNNNSSINLDSIYTCDSFLNGDYENSLSTAQLSLNIDPENPVLFLIAAHSKALIKNANTNTTSSNTKPNQEVPIKDVILDHLSKVIRVGPISASKEVNELNKLAINFSCFSWSSIIKIILAQESTIFSLLDTESALSVLKIPYLHPLFIELTRQSSIYQLYLDACSKNCISTISIEYMKAKLGIKNNLRNFRLGTNSNNLLLGIRNFEDENYSNSIISGKALSNTHIGYFARKGIGFVSHSYFKDGDYENSCKSSVEFYLNDKNIFPFLPLKELYESIKPGSDRWDEISSLIDFPIILDAYVKHIDLKGETERRFAYEDFLINNEMTRPSELKTVYERFDREKLIYYLRFICVEANMDTSSAFEGGSKEIVEERLEVCKLLSIIDENNSDIYISEINDLIKKQIIINRRREVDQSRIYIDISSVKEWITNNMEESYDRYIAYRKHGLDFNDNEVESKSKHKNIVSDSLPNILIPEDEVNGLLKDILEEFVSAYLSPEFGLDRFLSTRIRHGILEGHLRKPIANHYLITKKEFKRGPYLPNKYWFEKLNIIDQNIKKELTKLLNSFSYSYDNLILSITTDWLQVRSSKKPKGLFVFNISDKDITNIANTITPETSFLDFIDIVINDLESLLILNLANIRKKLHDNAKPEAKLYLKELQEGISKKINILNSNELLGAINQARTDMQTQFDKVIEWFVPSATGNSSPFTLEETMQVAETIISESSPNFKINLKSNGLDDFQIHGNLPIFVDIFVNIFENVVKRSGLEVPIADCEIWIETPLPEVKLVYFKVSNELNIGNNLESINLELKRKKELLDQGNYKQYVSSDVNSGLFKIHKSVSDFRVSEHDKKGIMDFGIEENRFQIIICVPFRIFKLEVSD